MVDGERSGRSNPWKDLALVIAAMDMYFNHILSKDSPELDEIQEVFYRRASGKRRELSFAGSGKEINPSLK